MRNYSKMKRTLTALIIAATMFASSASAFDPDDLQRLKDTNECVQCDLRGANLRDANLKDANLRSALLFNADLSGADLENTHLGEAYMKGVILCNTTISDGSVIYSRC